MLQLREKVEELLNNSNLGFLHIERNQSGQLVLAGECGQPLVTIKGVSVPSAINAKEREYLWTLINRFISGKLEDIKIIIEHKRNPIDPDSVSDKYGFEHVNIDVEGSIQRSTHDLPGGDTVHIAFGKKKMYIASKQYSMVSFKDMSKVLAGEDMYRKVLIKYELLYKKQKAMNAVVNALQTCTI